MKKLIKKIVLLLKRRKFKLSTAESCTGGMLSSYITSVSGSSKVFTIGLILSSLFIFGYAVSAFSEYLISGQFFYQLKVKKVQKKQLH